MRCVTLFACALLLAACQTSGGSGDNVVKQFDSLMDAQASNENGCPSAQMSRSQIDHGEAVKRCACAGDVAKATTSPNQKREIISLILKMKSGSITPPETARLSELLEPAKRVHSHWHRFEVG
jgi:predicted small secreted protein